MAVPRSVQGKRVLVCILQDEKLTNASGLEGFFLIRLWACEFYSIYFFFFFFLLLVRRVKVSNSLQFRLWIMSLKATSQRSAELMG